MASLAKKDFWSNVLNWLLLIAEGGRYAIMIYVEKIIIIIMFFKGDQKNSSYEETENITRSVLQKRSSWCFQIFDYL